MSPAPASQGLGGLVLGSCSARELWSGKRKSPASCEKADAAMHCPQRGDTAQASLHPAVVLPLEREPVSRGGTCEWD